MTVQSGQPFIPFDPAGYSAASCGQPGKIKIPEDTLGPSLRNQKSKSINFQSGLNKQIKATVQGLKTKKDTATDSNYCCYQHER